MIECIRGFVHPRPGMSQSAMIERFMMNAFEAGIVVHRVIHCEPIGDGVYSILANVDLGGKK